jgi:hypothetical protein
MAKRYIMANTKTKNQINKVGVAIESLNNVISIEAANKFPIWLDGIEV